MALNPDTSNNYSNEITTDGAVNYGYPKPTYTDQYASDGTPGLQRGISRIGGFAPGVIHETSKREFEEMVFETNKRLQNMRFGENQRTYGALTQAKAKAKKALQMASSNNPKMKEKGLRTLKNMDQTGFTELNNSQALDKNIQNAKPEGQKIASKPKQTGNGKSHSPKNGIIY